MDDATGDDATDNATVDVDEVLDKLLDNVIEAYGSSARDVYTAIFSPGVAENEIARVLSGQQYDALRETVARIQQVAASNNVSYTTFSMKVVRLPGDPDPPRPKSSLDLIGLKLWFSNTSESSSLNTSTPRL